jgi:nitroreductase
MELFEAIKDRRSIRAFKSDPVPEELLKKALDAARWAPSAGNCQPRDFIIVRDPNVKRNLRKAALNQYFIESAPLNIVVCSNENRSANRYGERGRSLYCLLDAAASTQNLLLALHALGLGACWIGAFSDKEVMNTLNLPYWLRPIAIIPIGYPAEKPRSTSRMSLETSIHNDRFRRK